MSSQKGPAIQVHQTQIVIEQSDDWVQITVDGEALFNGHRFTANDLEELLLRLNPLYQVTHTWLEDNEAEVRFHGA